jgi:hypothetical protein
MTEDWAKNLAERIASAEYSEGELDPNSARIVKLAERARNDAADTLFRMFIDRVEDILRHLEQGEEKGILSRLFRKGPSVLNCSISQEVTFRFQTRDAWGSRLEVDYDRGVEPRLSIDVAAFELISGDYLPIFRDCGAIAGAQIWLHRRAENRHPNLLARLYFILSITALSEGLSIKDSVSWVYEDDLRPFTARSVEELMETLIATA